MSRSIGATSKIALFAQETDQVFLVLLEIDHADLGSLVRLVNNTQNVTSNGNMFTACAFKFDPPIEVDGTIKPSRLTIDNIDRQIVDMVRSLDSAPTVEASIIRAAAPDTIEAGPWSFYLRNVSYNADVVSGELLPEHGLRLNASTVRYRNIEFPGLYG
nr:hypothetical protein 2 [bacterium]